MINRRKRTALYAVICAMCISSSALADMGVSYNDVFASHKNPADYMRAVPSLEGTVNMIRYEGVEGTTYTETNIRFYPDAASEKVGTVKTGTRVKLWGLTENGWFYICTQDEEGNYMIGYMRSDLLDPISNEGEAQTQETTE